MEEKEPGMIDPEMNIGGQRMKKETIKVVAEVLAGATTDRIITETEEVMDVRNVDGGIKHRMK